MRVEKSSISECWLEIGLELKVVGFATKKDWVASHRAPGCSWTDISKYATGLIGFLKKNLHLLQANSIYTYFHLSSLEIFLRILSISSTSTESDHFRSKKKNPELYIVTTMIEFFFWIVEITDQIYCRYLQASYCLCHTSPIHRILMLVSHFS